MKKGTLFNKILLGIMVIGAIFMIMPFLWMIGTSFKSPTEIFITPPRLLPIEATFENYINLFIRMPKFFIYLKNTGILVVSTLFFGLLINSMAGYAFAKMKFPGKEKLFLAILVTLMIPGEITLIPYFLIIFNLGLYDTMLGVAIGGFASAFSVFLFRQFMASIPSEQIEAARIDGAGEIRTYFKIILPESKPVFATLGIMTFYGSWNSFLFPSILVANDSKYTLSVGLSLIRGQQAFRSDFGIQMAGAVLVLIPVIIFFIFAQRYIVEGVSISGLK